MNKFKIQRNTNGDSRVCKNVPTITDFTQANDDHRHHVFMAMNSLSAMINTRGRSHDNTKAYEPEKSQFYRDLCKSIEDKNIDFTKLDWYQDHVKSERHHLNSYVPEDVNLIDVIEMVADCVCAGLARTGNIRPIEIDPEVLTKAVNNTALLIKDMFTLNDEEEIEEIMEYE